MFKMHIRITFIEPILGTSPANDELYREFIGSKAPDAGSIEDEVAALGADAVAEKGMTVFPRTKDGIYCGKQTKDTEMCGIVYFRSGQKRFVPLDLIEEAEERS